MDPQGILKAFPKRKKIRADPSSKALAKVPRREEGEAGGELAHPQNSHTRTLSRLFSSRVSGSGLTRVGAEISSYLLCVCFGLSPCLLVRVSL